MADGRERQVSGHQRLASRRQLPQKTDPGLASAKDTAGARATKASGSGRCIAGLEALAWQLGRAPDTGGAAFSLKTRKAPGSAGPISNVQQGVGIPDMRDQPGHWKLLLSV